MTLKEALVTQVNSGMLTYSNHNTDNGFLNPKCYETEKALLRAGYEPVGISRNVPFNPHKTKQVAFVYRMDGEAVWCHLPLACWYNFLYDLYGGKQAEKILEDF